MLKRLVMLCIMMFMVSVMFSGTAHAIAGDAWSFMALPDDERWEYYTLTGYIPPAPVGYCWAEDLTLKTFGCGV
jgi:hypothetical protein